MREQVVEAFQAETIRGPEWEVVETDKPVDAEAGAVIVPGDAAGEPAEEPAAGELDAKDAGAVHRRTERQRPLPDPVVHRLEERLREAVDRHVEEAGTTTPRVHRHEQRVERPTGEAVGEEALTRPGKQDPHTCDAT